MTAADYRDLAAALAALTSVARQLDKPEAAAVWLTHDPGRHTPTHDTGVTVRPSRDESLVIVLTVDHTAAAERSGSDGFRHRLDLPDLIERITCDRCGAVREVAPSDLLHALAAYSRQTRDGRRYTHPLAWRE